jgi:hypothetical protein
MLRRVCCWRPAASSLRAQEPAKQRRIAIVIPARWVQVSRSTSSWEITGLSGLPGPDWLVFKARNRAQFFSAESGTASAAAWKPIFEWVPSQNGFFVDAPQRQSTVLS